MREILFRGKRTDNGEWIEGYYRDLDGEHPRILKENIFIGKFGRVLEFKNIDVIPETVGQYTGLTDKNGTKIFEGDICRFKRFNDVHVGEIVFNVTTASFIMWYQSIVGAYGEKATHQMLLSVCDDIEVIGNIHDNPELLGGENNGINR